MVWKFHTGQFQVHLPSSCEASIILSRVLGTSFDIRGREPECKPPSTSPTLELVPKSMLLGNLSDTILLHINKWNLCIFGCPPPNNTYYIYILTSEVWRQNFWLGLFSGAASPKPLMALSNSPFIRGLNLGAMTSETKKRNNFVKTTCAFAEKTTRLAVVVLYRCVATCSMNKYLSPLTG